MSTDDDLDCDGTDDALTQHVLPALRIVSAASLTWLAVAPSAPVDGHPAGGVSGGTVLAGVILGGVVLTELTGVIAARRSRRRKAPITDSSPAAPVVTEGERPLSTAADETPEARQLATMRRMACGLAHDFNNLLTVIRSAAQLQRLISRDGGAQFETLADIEDATERGTALTAHLLTFGAPNPVTPVALHPALLVRHALPLLRQVAGENVLVDVHADAAVAGTTIEADPVHVERLLVSLVSQGCGAMPSGGSIAITCRAVTTGEVTAHRNGALPPGRYVTVSVQDTGVMNAAAAAHHRQAARSAAGSRCDHGVGDGIDDAAVQSANGAVIVTSTLTGGTCRTVYWPQLDVTSSGMRLEPSMPLPAPTPVPVNVSMPASTAPPASLKASPCTILLVDDDESVCRVVQRQLQGSGFAVLTAGCAEDALTMLRDPDLPVSAVVSDVRMPGMSGVELVTTMLAEGIQRPVVLVSGMMDEVVPEHWPETAHVRFLAKPLSGVALRHAVSDVLASRDRVHPHEKTAAPTR